MRALVAKHFGTCPLCGSDIIPGHPIVLAASLDESDNQEHWQHVWCAQQAKYKHRVTSGETFASRKPGDWRRKPTRRRSL